MRIVPQQSQKREVFAEKETIGTNPDGSVRYEFVLSPVRGVENGRRPVNRYDSEQELLQAANSKGCRVTWLIS